MENCVGACSCVEACECVGVCNNQVSKPVVIGSFLIKLLEMERRNLLQGVELAYRWAWLELLVESCSPINIIIYLVCNN